MKTNKVRFAVITTGPNGVKVRFVRERGSAKERRVFRKSDAARINRVLNSVSPIDVYTWISENGARQGTEIHNS